MARKNDRVRTRNVRREFAGPRVRTPNHRVPRIQLEQAIIPDGRCTGRRPKARFASLEKAEQALKQAQVQRSRIGTTWVEKRVYECPLPSCGGWHLSSRDSFDEGQATRLHNQRNEDQA